MNTVSNSGSYNLADFVVLVKTKKDDSEPGLEGFAFLREDMRKEYEAYIGALERAAYQADIAAAKSDRPVKLTDEQITYLANKYNPRKMTEKEYNAFMYEMIDMGVVTREDARFIPDWEGGGCVPSFTPGTTSGGKHASDEDLPVICRGRDGFRPHCFQHSNGDVLTLYGYKSAFRSYAPDTGKLYYARAERTYGKIYTVLQQMDNKNPECVQARQTSYQKRYQTSRMAWNLRNRSC